MRLHELVFEVEAFPLKLELNKILFFKPNKLHKIKKTHAERKWRKRSTQHKILRFMFQKYVKKEKKKNGFSGREMNTCVWVCYSDSYRYQLASFFTLKKKSLYFYHSAKEGNSQLLFNNLQLTTNTSKFHLPYRANKARYHNLQIKTILKQYRYLYI